MALLFRRESLPHLHSTRDTRDRLDLITENVPVDARRIRADRIVYHPGDTAAKHYHADCQHLFFVLRGEGLLHVDGESKRLHPGMVAVVNSEEVHSFENDTVDEFAFVEFWAPPPTRTVWVVPDDV